MIALMPPPIADRLDAAPIEGLETIAWNQRCEPIPPRPERVEIWIPDGLYPFTSATEALTVLTGVKLIQLTTAGSDNWTKVLQHPIAVCNARGVHTASTAEIALLGLLAHTRQLPRLLEQQRAGDWRPAASTPLSTFHVAIIGAGDIGTRVADVLRRLDATVTLVGRESRPGVAAVSEIDTVIRHADAVILALPHTDKTHHLVDAEFLAALRDGAIVVNVGRGGVLDTDALVAELRRGRLKASLDVVDPEPLPAGHPLWLLPNAIISPHIGGGAEGWIDRIMPLVRAQVTNYLAGEPPINQIRPAPHRR